MALLKTATASTSENGNGPAKAVDGDVGTRWCASSAADNNWIKVDLGALHTLTGAEIVWEKGAGTSAPDAQYKFKIDLSPDDVAWNNIVDQSTNVSTAQTQTYPFAGSPQARYARVTVLDVVSQSTVWACTLEVRILGY